MTVTLRDATAADCGLLFGWVNQPDSLAGKLITNGPIPRTDHNVWFARALSDPETRIWIVESNGDSAGQLRLTARSGSHEVDIYVAPAFRRSDIARQAMAQAVEKLSAPCTLRARVKQDNAASQRLFERAGFTLHERHPDHLIYDRVIDKA